MTRKQQLFIAAYLKDLNATSAAIAAGYSQHTAGSQGQALLQKPEISRQIQEKLGQIIGNFEISQRRVLQELARIGFADTRKLFDETGALRHITELDDDTAAAIAGIEHEKLFEHFGKGEAKHIGTTTKIKMNNKNQALEMLGKYLKLFNDLNQTNIQVNISLAGEITERRKQIDGDTSQSGA
jgi:phage terminase small subunit